MKFIFDNKENAIAYLQEKLIILNDNLNLAEDGLDKFKEKHSDYFNQNKSKKGFSKRDIHLSIKDTVYYNNLLSRVNSLNGKIYSIERQIGLINSTEFTQVILED